MATGFTQYVDHSAVVSWSKVRGNSYSVCCGLQKCLFASVGRVREDGCVVNGALTAIAQGERSMSQDEEEENMSDGVVGKFRLQASGSRTGLPWCCERVL